jgi:serine/threonine protein kinase
MSNMAQSDRWREVRRIFDAAVEVKPELRAAFLDVARLADDLRQEVELLLEAVEATSSTECSTRDAFRVSPFIGPRFVDDSSDEQPPSIEGYVLEERLATGGTSSVYSARAAKGTPVAIKVLTATATNSMLQRFRQECRVLASLRHPGIVRVLEAGSTSQRRLYLVMERISGETLDVWSRQATRDIAARVEVVARILDILEYAHAHGVVHRDLKPTNVLVEPDGSPRLLDFGIARLELEDNRRTGVRTLTGNLMGSFSYMSPEQADGRSSRVGPATDVYQCAVLVYELLTGRLPYEVGGTGTMPLLRAILFDRRVPLRQCATEAGERLAAVVDAALSIELTCRPQSAARFASALRAALEVDTLRNVESSEVRNTRAS